MKTTEHSTQLDRIEHTVIELSGKIDTVIEQGTTTETQLHDLRSELQHYSTVMSGIARSLKNDERRTNVIFAGLGFGVMGLMLWIVASI